MIVVAAAEICAVDEPGSVTAILDTNTSCPPRRLVCLPLAGKFGELVSPTT